MRLAVCTLSAVLLSGCSWLGMGGNSSSYNYGSAGYGCAPGYGAQSGGWAQQSQYGYGHSAGCAAGGYAVAGQGGGYGMNGAGGYGAGMNGYGVGTNGLGLRGGQGQAGAYGTGGAGGFGPGAGMGAGGYGAGMGAGGYGAGYGGVTGVGGAGAYGAGTMLGANAPYGSAAGGQFVNGQWVSGGSGTVYGTQGNVTTVQGAPIYVPQPYPAYYGAAYNAGGGYGYGFGGGLRGVGAAMPFGLEVGVGTNFGIGGDIIGDKPAGVATGGTLNVSSTPALSYKDAWDVGATYDLAATYDVDPSTTLLARIGYAEYEGQRNRIGTIDDGTTTEDLYAELSDMEEVTLEGGVRKYMGGWNNGMSGIRPYIGATAGFTHNNEVMLSQDSETLMPMGSNVQQMTDAGWRPTASGTLGAEMQVGPRTALGVETGVRWTDDLNNNFGQADDRWSVPMKVRGRISF